MWRKILQGSEGLVNILSLALLCFISLAVYRSQLVFPRALSRTAVHVGQTLAIKDIDWRRKQHTLVFALQSTCHFCAESAPFYRELLSKEQAGDWQPVAVFPQSTETSVAYMRTEGYSIPEVRQMSLDTIGVPGTPTLLLVDQSGKVEKSWPGKLSDSQEDEVASALGFGKLSHFQEASLVPPLRLGIGDTTPAVAGEAEQDGMKSLRLTRPGKEDPVRISALLEGKNDVAPFLHDLRVAGNVPNPYALWDRVPFAAGDDWLSSLVVTVKNVSSKEMVAGSLNLRFPETGSGKTPDDAFVGQVIYLGRVPEQALYASDGHKVSLPSSEPIDIRPGEELRFVVAPYMNEIRRAVSTKSPFSTVTTCQIVLGYFYFSDGTRWAPFAGFQKADSRVPGKYTGLDWSEFQHTAVTE